jgi:hypothetical protein
MGKKGIHKYSNPSRSSTGKSDPMSLQGKLTNEMDESSDLKTLRFSTSIRLMMWEFGQNDPKRYYIIK